MENTLEATDVIEKRVELRASLSRVWRALTDHHEFGEWFQMKPDGPFVPGQTAVGHITYPGYEHLKWQAEIKAMQPEHYFSFTWHPYAVDPKVDYATEPQTLVEFRLAASPTGTLLTITESGFSKLPKDRRSLAFQRNESGWLEQMRNIEAYVAQSAE